MLVINELGFSIFHLPLTNHQPDAIYDVELISITFADYQSSIMIPFGISQITGLILLLQTLVTSPLLLQKSSVALHYRQYLVIVFIVEFHLINVLKHTKQMCLYSVGVTGLTQDLQKCWIRDKEEPGEDQSLGLQIPYNITE